MNTNQEKLIYQMFVITLTLRSKTCVIVQFMKQEKVEIKVLVIKVRVKLKKINYVIIDVRVNFLLFITEI